ncbi:MAG: Mrp/NBP35 family ATP-binding protein [Candidatus Asgardarchaeia archaeon]
MKQNIAIQLQNEEKKIAEKMGKIKHKILIFSGKGGVGKSTVSANLAFGLAHKGFSVGVLDADFHGPDIPLLMGVQDKKPTVDAETNEIIPGIGPLGIKIMSIGFLIDDPNRPVVWRGPLKLKAIREFLMNVKWGEMDFLIVDFPPGTGAEILTAMQSIPNIDGTIVVTTPQEVALLDSRKAVTMSKLLNVPLLGVIENMAGFICPHCGQKTYIFGIGGGENAAKQLGVDFLGRLPLDVRVRELSDEGKPFIIEYPEAEVSRAFMEIVDKILEKVGKKDSSN